MVVSMPEGKRGDARLFLGDQQDLSGRQQLRVGHLCIRDGNLGDGPIDALHKRHMGTDDNGASCTGKVRTILSCNNRVHA